MINYIAKKFDEEINRTFTEKRDIRNFLLNHERKNLCINNLAAELGKLENYPLKIDLIKLNAVIRDIANLFMRIALEAKEKEILSQSEKLRQIKEATDLNEYIKELDKGNDARVDELNSNIK